MRLSIVKEKLSSIHAKLFLWFWLITIVSISTTRLISTQLAEDSVLLPAHKGDLRFLYHLQAKIKKRQPADLDSLLTKQKARGGKSVLLKNTSTNEVLSKTFGRMSRLKDYLEKNSLDHIASVQFPFARITGPLDVKIADQDYQLYVASRNMKHGFEEVVMRLPRSVRFSIPLVISFVLCWLLAKTLSRPLDNMQATAAKLGEGNLSARVEKADKRNDELGSLARSFNKMAEKLELSLGAQQRLLADVSHELRSPMTRLQLALGLAQKNATSPDELAKHLARCEKEVTRLDEMVADVLSLSRLENTMQPLHLEKIDIAAVLSILVQDAQFLADEKAIIIEASKVPVTIMEADSQLLASAIGNILTNAVKYSDRHSTIKLGFEQASQTLTLTISDTGPGVPEAALSQLFKPFYRVAEARDRKTGGTGLGLAIAKQAIMAHKGSISAHNNLDKGLTVTIELPLSLQTDTDQEA